MPRQVKTGIFPSFLPAGRPEAKIPGGCFCPIGPAVGGKGQKRVSHLPNRRGMPLPNANLDPKQTGNTQGLESFRPIPPVGAGVIHTPLRRAKRCTKIFCTVWYTFCGSFCM